MSWYVESLKDGETWREQTIPASVVGLDRDITVFRSSRQTNLITHDPHGDAQTFCPPMWWDLAIRSGCLRFRLQSMFLTLTHRAKRDPLRHLLYDNIDDFAGATEKWVTSAIRRHQRTLGVGIDRSDSLLYEGVTPHVRTLAPLFGNETYNSNGNKLVLLTKSANTHYLDEIKEEHHRTS